MIITPLLQNLKRDDPEERIITTGVSWYAYETFLKILEDNNCYRISYLDKTLEIVSPSRAHEGIKKRISLLIEAYLTASNIRFYPLGSTTFRQAEKRGGKEPDESYCFETEKDFPDLAIEVIFTSGGLDSLEIYQRLEIPEVWFWQNQNLSIYGLIEGEYRQYCHSPLLPNLDITFLSDCIRQEDSFDALQTFRQSLLN